MAQPAFCSTMRIASTGVIITHLGSRPLVACATMRASGVRPRAAASAADITTSAAAPSFSPGALPAVTVPVGVKAGLSAARVIGVVSSRTDSSRSNTTAGPFFAAIDTGRISSAKAPAARAATALLWLAAA